MHRTHAGTFAGARARFRPPADQALAPLQQQGDDQILLVVEVADQGAPELDLRVAETAEVGAERVRAGRFAREHGGGALDDAADRGMERAMIALEQLETGRKAWLRPPEQREIVVILDLMVLLELP